MGGALITGGAFRWHVCGGIPAIVSYARVAAGGGARGFVLVPVSAINKQ